jgi:hypothetical protein
MSFKSHYIKEHDHSKVINFFLTEAKSAKSDESDDVADITKLKVLDFATNNKNKGRFYTEKDGTPTEIPVLEDIFGPFENVGVYKDETLGFYDKDGKFQTKASLSGPILFPRLNIKFDSVEAMVKEVAEPSTSLAIVGDKKVPKLVVMVLKNESDETINVADFNNFDRSEAEKYKGVSVWSKAFWFKDIFVKGTPKITLDSSKKNLPEYAVVYGFFLDDSQYETLKKLKEKKALSTEDQKTLLTIIGSVVKTTTDKLHSQSTVDDGVKHIIDGLSERLLKAIESDFKTDDGKKIEVEYKSFLENLLVSYEQIKGKLTPDDIDETSFVLGKKSKDVLINAIMRLETLGLIGTVPKNKAPIIGSASKNDLKALAFNFTPLLATKNVTDTLDSFEFSEYVRNVLANSVGDYNKVESLGEFIEKSSHVIKASTSDIAFVKKNGETKNSYLEFIKIIKSAIELNGSLTSIVGLIEFEKVEGKTKFTSKKL